MLFGDEREGSYIKQLRVSHHQGMMWGGNLKLDEWERSEIFLLEVVGSNLGGGTIGPVLALLTGGTEG